jgi:hypothetical protein
MFVNGSKRNEQNLMKEFNLEVDYLITNDSSGPMKQVDFKYSAPGKI